jgi:Nucleotidyl transferase AbiEii toxin, Type IV TA system
MSATSNDDVSSALTGFQITVARLFFTMPASERFLLAGGAALVAQHLSERPTQDLDLFTRLPGDVTSARDELEALIVTQGWVSDRITDTATFCRLIIHGPDDLLVDLAVDSPPGHPATASFVGPTFAPEELAGRKLLALFDRAAARDFVDVFALSDRYDKKQLLAEASALDAGFTAELLAGQIATLGRFGDADLPVAAGKTDRLRAFFAEWCHELRG